MKMLSKFVKSTQIFVEAMGTAEIQFVNIVKQSIGGKGVILMNHSNVSVIPME